MALTAAGARLTDLHRRAQASLSARATAQLLAVWPLLSGDDLDGTAPRWLDASLPVVATRHAESASLALAYLRRFRSIEVPDAEEFVEPPPPALDTAAASTSLIVRGPVLVRQLVGAGKPVETAIAQAAPQMAAAGIRHVLAGGRDASAAYAAADPAAVGARRVARPGACAFCAMLAARSIDGLSSDATRSGMGSFRVHDNCNCTSETVYASEGGDPRYVERSAKEFAALYRDAQNSRTGGRGGGGNPALNAFRRALEAQRRGD